jgi:ABC-2 type transport system permease protein
VLVVWTTAATVLGAALTVFRRDLNFAVPLALRALFIATPVMYPVRLLDEAAPWLSRLNPLAVVLEGTRDAIYRNELPDAGLLGVHLVIGSALLVVSFLVLRRLEPRMSDFV